MARATTVPARTSTPSGRSRLHQQLRRYWWGYLFIAPWVIIYLIFGIYPLVLSFFLTYFNYSFVNPGAQAFVGLGNWIRAFGDPLFWKGISNIFVNQTIFILLKNGLGLLIAALLFRVRFGGRFFRTVYFLPVLTSTVVLMTIGDKLTSPDGPIQHILLSTNILLKPVFWKADPNLPMIVIALINTWKWFGISVIILLAGMYGIDQRMFEAAQVDGASGWKLFRHITLPSLRPQLFFLLVVDVINGLQMFGEVYSLGFDVYGGVNHQAITPVLYLYAAAFDRSNMGYASTLGLLLALLIAIVTIFQFRFVPANGD
jgi:ABC-type sugar transport system permease subunit